MGFAVCLLYGCSAVAAGTDRAWLRGLSGLRSAAWEKNKFIFHSVCCFDAQGEWGMKAPILRISGEQGGSKMADYVKVAVDAMGGDNALVRWLRAR